MALALNKTANPNAVVHGVNPTFLIDQIVRNRIYSNRYWNEKCFGLTAATLVDRAIELRYIGGTFGGNQQPTPFLCLILKMLQLQPSREIVMAYINNDDYKYVRLLGAVYMRLVGDPVHVYKVLEPLYSDYRKIREKDKLTGYKLSHVDEFIHELLTKEYVCGITLPHLPKRAALEHLGLLTQRESLLDVELEMMQREMEQEDENSDQENLEQGTEESEATQKHPSASIKSDKQSEKEEGGGREHHSQAKEGDQKASSNFFGPKNMAHNSQKQKEAQKPEIGPQMEHKTQRDKKMELSGVRQKTSSAEKDDSMTIEQTNALRASLGLRPLKF